MNHTAAACLSGYTNPATCLRIWMTVDCSRKEGSTKVRKGGGERGDPPTLTHFHSPLSLSLSLGEINASTYHHPTKLPQSVIHTFKMHFVALAPLQQEDTGK